MRRSVHAERDKRIVTRMGSMSFLLPNPLPGAAAAGLGEACVASVGYHDQTPEPTVVTVADGV
ncbi:MAG TPA: hypothetical protein VGE74_27390, partial [Gemmata sp.]